jgi:hypothetical protein
MGEVKEDYTKNIEIKDSRIIVDYNTLPYAAYLCIELQNNGDKNVANLNFEISYNDTDGYFLEKAVLKNALKEALPREETRKYKIRLKGDVVNIEREQYPYSQPNKVGDFKLKIIDVKLARK